MIDALRRNRLLKSLWDWFKSFRITGILFSKLDSLLGFPVLKRKFKRHLGYPLDLNNPKSYNEKLNWRKVYDRNPLFPIVADKYKVRRYLRKILGEKEAEKILIPLLHVTEDPESIPFDDLPEEYVVKANNGSGTNILVTKDSDITREEIISRCKDWLRVPYGTFSHEWAYSQIRPKIIVEKLIRDEDGNIPKDYKFHVFHGRCELIQVDNGRFTNHNRSLFKKNWDYIDGSLKYIQGPDMPKPKHLSRMLELAEKIAKEFDYIRIDLYDTGKKVYAGEITMYHGSGFERFTPEKLDFEYGKLWKIRWNKNEIIICWRFL